MRKIYVVLIMFCLMVIHLSCEPQPQKSEYSAQTVRESVFVVYRVEPDPDNCGFSFYSIRMFDYKLMEVDFKFRDYSGKYLVGDPLHLNFFSGPGKNTSTADTVKVKTSTDSIWSPKNINTNDNKPTNISKK